ncbi:MAG TPA: hypothetical protein VGM72_03105 [Micropepsaceae bacterium]|jgi:hypothetical protein
MQDFVPLQEKSCAPNKSWRSKASSRQNAPLQSRSDASPFAADFSRVPIQQQMARGSGPGEGGSKQPSPATDQGPDLPPANPSLEVIAPQTDPAQGAVPMTQVAVGTIKANIGPNGRSIAHVPPCGNQPAIQFTAGPATAKPVTWTIDAGSPAAGTALTPGADTLTAALSLGAAQKGGVLDIKAENNEGGQVMPYRLASHPTGIASTNVIGDPTDSSLFGGVFDHVFKSNDGQVTSLDQVVMGERFPKLATPEAATHKMTTPFGEFTLQTGTLPDIPAKGNWFMNDSGELGDNHDTVGIQKSLIDVGRHLASDSNPTPANPMPVGFTADQEFHWWCPHGAAGSRWNSANSTTTHERTLRLDKSGKNAEFVAKVNGKENVMAYDGDPKIVLTGVTHAKADHAAVETSAAGRSANTIQISADLFPSSRDAHFSIRGNALGCKIDASSGELTIGSKPGTVKVRVANAKDGPNWDEVDVTVTAPAAPKTTPANATSVPAPRAGADAPPSDL